LFGFDKVHGVVVGMGGQKEKKRESEKKKKGVEMKARIGL
jgi:hypothetical protein